MVWQQYEAAGSTGESAIAGAPPLLYAARLFYYLLFSPSRFRAHVAAVAPGLASRPCDSRLIATAISSNPGARHLLLHMAAGLSSTAALSSLLGAGGKPDPLSVLGWVLVSVIVVTFVGAAVATLAARTTPVEDALLLGAAAGLLAALCMSLVFGQGYKTLIISHLAAGVFSLLVIGLLCGLAEAISSSVILCALLALLDYFNSGRDLPMPLMSLAGLVAAMLAGILRAPIYPMHALAAIAAYRKARNLGPREAAELLRRSPVYADDFLVLPQPCLAAFLLLVARKDLRLGLEHISRVASSPAQRWAAAAASRRLLEGDGVPFFVFVTTLLEVAVPYHAVGMAEVTNHAGRGAFSTIEILLGELSYESSRPERMNGPERLMRFVTSPLRPAGASTYAALAAVYIALLKGGADPLRIVIDELQRSRRSRLPHGEEFFRNFRAFLAARRCLYLSDVARSRQALDDALEVSDPLLPGVHALLLRLASVACDAARFVERARDHEFRRVVLRSALDQLSSLAGDVAALADPERTIFQSIVSDWERIFFAEGLSLVYVTDRPLVPSDGSLFVRRGELSAQIAQAFDSGISVCLVGEGLAGKTSILLHLSSQLSAGYRVAFFDALLTPFDSDAEFLLALMDAASAAARDCPDWRLPPLPSAGAMTEDPYSAFDLFIRAVEAGAPEGCRVVIGFDNFQSLDIRAQQGQITREALGCLKELLHGEHATLFAFAHNPHYDRWLSREARQLLIAARPVPVPGLDRAECASLITRPFDGGFPISYTPAQLDRIAGLTLGRPYLVQEVCRNIVCAFDCLTLPRRGGVEVDDLRVDAALKKTLSTAGVYFRDMYWESLSYQQRVALAAIAEASASGDVAWVGYEEVERCLGGGAAAALESLERSGLIEATGGEAPSYRFRINLALWWFFTNHPLRSVLSSIAEGQQSY